MARTLGRPATLDDIPDAELDRLAELGEDIAGSGFATTGYTVHENLD